MTTTNGAETGSLVILFDGVCNLCNGWVTFVIDRDPEGQFRFANLQSDRAKSLTDEVSIPIDSDTILLFDDGEVFQKSDAILKIVSRLGGGWPALSLLRLVPRFVRDPVYDLVARNRYSWFGRRDQCRVPTQELQARFL